MGRPTKFDTAVADRICDAVRLGCTWNLAALAGGVDPKTLREWKAKGRAGEEPYGPFLLRLKEAEAEAALAALTVIRNAALDGTWTASAWLLERRYPRSYGRRDVRADVTQKHSVTVANYEALTDDAKAAKLRAMALKLTEEADRIGTDTATEANHDPH